MYYSNIAAITTVLTTCLSLTTPTLAHDQKSNTKGGGGGGFTIKQQSLPDFWVPSRNEKVQNVLQMKRRPGAKPINSKYVQALRSGKQVDGVYGSEEIDVTDTGTSILLAAT